MVVLLQFIVTKKDLTNIKAKNWITIFVCTLGIDQSKHTAKSPRVVFFTFVIT